jgi:hypothetical protein
MDRTQVAKSTLPEKRTLPYDVLVVDHCEQTPTAN